jgi:ATP-dependent protease HslVU (ClpYQ) peptidase subunit
MTCVVGLADKESGKVFIGADSLTANDYGITQVNMYPKIAFNGDFLIGCAGSARVAEIMHHIFEPPAFSFESDNIDQYMVKSFVPAMQECIDKANAKEEQKETGSCVLIGLKGRLFCIKSKYAVEEPSCGYEAIGSSGEVALGVLWATRDRDIPPDWRIELALKASAEHNAFVREPFLIKSV